MAKFYAVKEGKKPGIYMSLKKIPLHQRTIRNYYGMFIFFIHRYNHSEPAANRPAPYLHTFFRRNGHR